MVLVDTPSNGWSHMVADNLDELHTFAQSIGLKRCWFQNKRGKNQPHYDVRLNLRRKAIERGAKEVSRKELFEFLKEHFHTS